ncbi:MAG: hypothetical protein WC788_06285 [Candidatus Paceibacterota bacterium]
MILKIWKTKQKGCEKVKIRMKILAIFLLAGALLISGCVSDKDPGTISPKVTEVAISEASPGSSGSSGNSGNVGPGVTETPKNSDAQSKIEVFKSDNWYDFFEDSTQPQTLDLGDLKIKVYAGKAITVVSELKPDNARFYLEYQFKLRNKKSSKTVMMEKCITEAGGGNCPGIDAIKEWEWSVEITKVNAPPAQPNPTARHPEKLIKTT